jgi:quercetin dioxygenase-like cupin family protein
MRRRAYMTPMSLIVRKIEDEPGEPMPGEGHRGVNSVMVVDETQVSSYSCRVLRIEPGGATASHSHPRTHVVMALSGAALIETDQETAEIRPGVVVTVPGDVLHRFVNVANRRTTLLVQNLFPRESLVTP